MQWHFVDTCERRFRHLKLSQDGHEACKEFSLLTLTASLWKTSCVIQGGVNQSRNTVVCVFQGEIYATQRDSSATVHPRAVWQIRLPFLFSTGTMITRSRSWAKLCVTCIKTFHFARAPGRFSPEATFLCVYLVFLRTIKVSERCADHVKG